MSVHNFDRSLRYFNTTLEAYEEFLDKYYHGDFKDQRVGQAFRNHFGILQDIELFYADAPKSIAIIRHRYLEEPRG